MLITDGWAMCAPPPRDINRSEYEEPLGDQLYTREVLAECDIHVGLDLHSIWPKLGEAELWEWQVLVAQPAFTFANYANLTTPFSYYASIIIFLQITYQIEIQDACCKTIFATTYRIYFTILKIMFLWYENRFSQPQSYVYSYSLAVNKLNEIIQ